MPGIALLTMVLLPRGEPSVLSRLVREDEYRVVVMLFGTAGCIHPMVDHLAPTGLTSHGALYIVMNTSRRAAASEIAGSPYEAMKRHVKQSQKGKK